MTIAEYFLSRLGHVVQDTSLAQLPVESNCGQDCKKAIDAAVVMMNACDRSVWPEVVAAAEHTVSIFWRG